MVFKNERWRYICGTANLTFAMVENICSQVGLSGGEINPNAAVSGAGETFWVEQVDSNGEREWLQNTVDEFDNFTCGSNNAKQITCGNVDLKARKMWGAKLVTPDKVFTEGIAGRLEVK